jgi:hypothetical protein
VPIEILPIDGDAGREALYRLQVTARSRLGAMALHTGGLLVEGGWLRVLGGGHPARGLPGLAEANGLDAGPRDAPPSILVGYDVLGGRFELNGADPAATGRPGEPGQMCYFAPDTLKWEPIDFGHGVWLSWIADGRTSQFYEGLRWPTWREETAALTLDQGIFVFPPLGTKEAHEDLAATSRAPVPITEIFEILGAS